MVEKSNHEGGCTCGEVRYRVEAAPMIVHACHCRWCQRETGSAFVVNALVEARHVPLLQGDVALIDTPSASGRGQKIARCPRCHVALWSHYPRGGPALCFVRVGTLDDPGAFPPDVHIFTSSKPAWLSLPDGAHAYAEFYDVPAVWPAESLARMARLRDA
jgi:hypothetical protein